MRRHNFTNQHGSFTIDEFSDGSFSVWGDVSAAKYEFKKIGRKPPNKYGNFYGREKAGFAACAELIKEART